MNKKVQKLLEELGSAAAKPTGTEHREGKALKVSFGNSTVYSPQVHQQSEEVESVIVENALSKTDFLFLLENLGFETKNQNIKSLSESFNVVIDESLDESDSIIEGVIEDLELLETVFSLEEEEAYDFIDELSDDDTFSLSEAIDLFLGNNQILTSLTEGYSLDRYVSENLSEGLGTFIRGQKAKGEYKKARKDIVKQYKEARPLAKKLALAKFKDDNSENYRKVNSKGFFGIGSEKNKEKKEAAKTIKDGLKTTYKTDKKAYKDYLKTKGPIDQVKKRQLETKMKTSKNWRKDITNQNAIEAAKKGVDTRYTTMKNAIKQGEKDAPEKARLAVDKQELADKEKASKEFAKAYNLKDVIKEDAVFTKNQLQNLFETLQLNTHKYTLEYLAEEMGFEPVKPIHTSGKVKLQTPKFLNSDIYTSDNHMQSEEVNAPIIESYTREDLEELFEALELDTDKYTFEFLAEQLGFEQN